MNQDRRRGGTDQGWGPKAINDLQRNNHATSPRVPMRTQVDKNIQNNRERIRMPNKAGTNGCFLWKLFKTNYRWTQRILRKGVLESADYIYTMTAKPLGSMCRPRQIMRQQPYMYRSIVDSKRSS